MRAAATSIFWACCCYWCPWPHWAEVPLQRPGVRHSRTSGQSADCGWPGGAGWISYRRMVAKQAASQPGRWVGMADGSLARICAGHLSVVPALAAALLALNIDRAAHHLDSQHHANLFRVVSAVAWARVAGPRLGPAAGVWIRRDSRCDCVASPFGAASVVKKQWG